MPSLKKVLFVSVFPAVTLPLLAASPVTDVPAANQQSIQIGNPACEAVISIKPFVRLASFRLTGHKNYLLNSQSPNPVSDGKALRPSFVVGAKLWYAPEIPDSHLFGLLPGTAVQTGREIEVKLDSDPISGLQGTIRYVLDDHQPRITITSILRNVGTTQKEVSCWWPVAFEPGGRMEAKVIPLPNDPIFRFLFWSYGASASDPACHIDHDKVSLDLNHPFLQKPIFKIGFLSKEIALTKPDCVYRLTAIDPAPGSQWTYPHGGSPVILYCDQRTWFCEAELSGPLARLNPGEATSFTFAISLETPQSNAKARDN